MAFKAVYDDKGNRSYSECGQDGQDGAGSGGVWLGEARALLSTDAAQRKAIPLCTGVLDYFGSALIEVAKCSLEGNRQHNGDSPLHWDKTKSTDHADALLRHLIDRGKVDTDGVLHSAKVAWRALALLQTELENAKAGK